MYSCTTNLNLKSNYNFIHCITHTLQIPDTILNSFMFANVSSSLLLYKRSCECLCNLVLYFVLIICSLKFRQNPTMCYFNQFYCWYKFNNNFSVPFIAEYNMILNFVAWGYWIQQKQNCTYTFIEQLSSVL